jgi:hypothetical protein
LEESGVNEIAKQTGFCKRIRKLKPLYFLELLLFKTFESKLESLEDHIYELKSERKVSIKKQSLQDRFTPEAVNFVKELVSNQFAKRNFFKNKNLLKSFSKVFVQDSTRFGLPKQMEEYYPGFKGAGAKSGAQIQFTYELNEHRIYDASLYAATRNDSLSSTENSWLEENSLVLRDLGYFSFKGLLEVIARKAFFISRAKPKTVFYEKQGDEVNKFNIKSLIVNMIKHEIQYLEKELIMGCDKKIPVRVIFSLVPEQLKAERLRKAYYNSKVRNWTVTEEFKLWAGINVFITNVAAQRMEMEKIPLIYKLRWQVELIFKTWKSHYKIHLYKAVKKERIECYLYGTLLLILLHWQLFSWLQHKFSEENKLLSIHKFTKLMCHLKQIFKQVILDRKNSFNQLISLIYSLAETLMKDKKKGKIGMIDVLYH